jgi:hypothetical protein
MTRYFSAEYDGDWWLDWLDHYNNDSWFESDWVIVTRLVTRANDSWLDSDSVIVTRDSTREEMNLATTRDSTRTRIKSMIKTN